jgi:hypothetical protein
MATESPTYQQLLQRAYDWGLDDGLFAAEFEPSGSVDAALARGRNPEEFAALLWTGQPGIPPSGLEVNAVRWYATGFRDALNAIVPVQGKGWRCTSGSGSAKRPTGSGWPTPRTVRGRHW